MFSHRGLFLAVTISLASIALAGVLVQSGYEHQYDSNNPRYSASTESSKSEIIAHDNDVAAKSSLTDAKHPTTIDSLLPENEPTDTTDKRTYNIPNTMQSMIHQFYTNLKPSTAQDLEIINMNMISTAEPSQPTNEIVGAPYDTTDRSPNNNYQSYWNKSIYDLISERNVLLLDSREDRLAHGSSGSFGRQRPSRGNESIETVGSGSFPNKISRLQVARNIDLEEGYKNTSANRRTLMDYNGPVIMEDPDDTSDQNLASHVRVKRNEPIVRRSSRSVKFVDSFPRNSHQLRTDAASIFGNSMFEGSLSDRENRSDSPTVVDTVVSRSRRKRGVLSKSGYRKKRVKGNVGHTKHHVEIKNGKKKNGVSKSSHQSRKKKTKDLSSREKNKNKGIRMPVRTTDESRIEKRESGNSDLNTDIDTANVEEAGGLISQKENALLTNNRSLAEQREENTVMLPFVHTGRAELRFRIEKLPVNESSFISPNRWTDCPVGTSPCSITSPKYNASDEILDLNVTNLELGPNFDSVAGRKANNLTVEITLKKLDRGSNASVPETSDPESTSLYNTESHPVRSNVPGIEDDRNTENGNYDRTNEMSAGSSDEKSRAKRNQEIMSKRYLRSDKNAKGSRRLKDTDQGIVIGESKRGKTGDRRTRGNRAVRSIEEIKNLAEKLIVKINELQVYVSNRTETLRVRDSCKDAVCAVDEEEPRTSLEKKDVSSSTSKIAKNVDSRQRFAKEAALAGKRISQTRSGGSRFARGEYRTSRRSRRKWGRWMDWSSCSVTCGKGRQIRWRHCLHDCNDAETEMEEKACQLPACPPSKFLGIF